MASRVRMVVLSQGMGIIVGVLVLGGLPVCIVNWRHVRMEPTAVLATTVVLRRAVVISVGANVSAGTLVHIVAQHPHLARTEQTISPVRTVVLPQG